MSAPNRKRQLVVQNVGEGMVRITYLAENYETDKEGKNGAWKEVQINRKEFRALLLNSKYKDRLVTAEVLQKWVAENSAPNFLRQGDWFVNTFPEDPHNPEDPMEPITSMWCLHGKIFISSVGPLPDEATISQILQPALAFA